MLTILSLLPHAIIFESGEKVTELTFFNSLSIVMIILLLKKSHSVTDFSLLPNARILELGEKATELI
jgi:hypothetical protein